MKTMEVYFAPMEGITGYVFRNVHRRHFGGVSRYMTPFLTPNQTRKLTSRELKDVLAEHNREIQVIPQILTRDAEDFCWAADKLASFGYTSINLNLGCPSGTVVSKGRGAGFLADPEALDRFFSVICPRMERMRIAVSVKTRIGVKNPEEFPRLLKIFNRYPLERLILHPRVREDYYRNHPRMEVYEWAERESQNPLAYNGDLFSRKDIFSFMQNHPNTDAVMLGRGLLTNPALMESENSPALSVERLEAFHRDLLESYRDVMDGDRNVLFKMKELWFYLADAFEGEKKQVKRIRKASRMAEYQLETDRLFAECSLRDEVSFRGGVK